LNLGRAYFESGQADDSEGNLSYAIYLASLADDQLIQSKSYYWRSKLRLTWRRYKAAVRDASCAVQLARMSANDDLIRECMSHERTALRLLDEDNKSIRRAVGELMDLCKSSAGFDQNS
jgi:hypothetical protein